MEIIDIENYRMPEHGIVKEYCFVKIGNRLIPMPYETVAFSRPAITQDGSNVLQMTKEGNKWVYKN